LDGINYAVHSLCTSASLPEKIQTVNIIVRPLGPGRAAMGRSFEDLKELSALSITIAPTPSCFHTAHAAPQHHGRLKEVNDATYVVKDANDQVNKDNAYRP
jgi:endonuclease IV